jgi:hypothetical protein
MRKASLGLLASLGLASTLILAACGSTAATTAGTTTTTGTSTTAAAASGNASTCKPGSALAVTGGFTEVCLPYNQEVFGLIGSPVTPGFDGGGNDLDPTSSAWPKETKAQATTTGVQTTASSVPFWFPPTGAGVTSVKSSVDLGPNGTSPVTIPVPAGKYSQLDLLGSAGNGCSSCLIDITFNYVGGTKDQTTQELDDWCSTTPVGQPGFMPSDRWNGGASTTPACGVFVYPIAIPGTTKTLQSVVLADDPASATNYEPEVLSMSLKNA